MLSSLLRGGAEPREIIIQLLLTLPIVLFSLTVHEYAHGYAALKCGDPTARNMGRLTLNPIKHLHPIGFLCMLFFGIGWANPVPINSRNFNNPRRDTAITAAAGPLSNLIIGVIFAFLYELSNLWLNSVAEGGGERMVLFAYVVTVFCFNAMYLNIYLAVFNLIPVPPFDGSRILFIFLPVKWYFGIMKYERYIMIGLLLLLYLGVLTGPIALAADGIINGILWLIELIPIF